MELWTSTAASLVTTLVFASSGLSKARAVRRFSETLRSYGAPVSTSGALAVTISVVELTLAVVWLVASDRRVVAAATVALLIGFSLAVVLAVRRGAEGSCGCGGVAGSDRIGPHVPVRNGLLVAVAAVGATSSVPVHEVIRGPVEALVLTGACAVLLLLTIHAVGSIGGLMVLTSELQAKLSERGKLRGKLQEGA